MRLMSDTSRKVFSSTAVPRRDDSQITEMEVTQHLILAQSARPNFNLGNLINFADSAGTSKLICRRG